MLVIHRRIDPQPVWAAELHLTFEARSKSRLRCFSAEGEDVGLFLERGQAPLYDGECLQAEDGRGQDQSLIAYADSHLNGRSRLKDNLSIASLLPVKIRYAGIPVGQYA